MAYFAVMDDYNVINTIVADSKEIAEEATGKICIEYTNDSASIGGTYDGTNFWAPQPYPSWLKDEQLKTWVAPIPKPEINSENPKAYTWDELTLSWILIS
jgi:hypothetical protein